MGMLKLIAAILIVAVGVIGAYMIIKTPDLSTDLNNDPLVDAAADAEKPSIKWFEKSENFLSEKIGGLSDFFASAKDTITQTVESPADTTKQVSSIIFNKLKSLDEQGENPFESLDLSNLDDPEVQALIQEAVESVQNPLLISTSTINDSQLKISSDNSSSVKIAYLEQIGKISELRFDDPRYKRTSENLMADINNDCFVGEENSLNKEFSILYQNLVDDYSNLSVPSDWLEIHKRMIIYFKKSNLVYRDLADCFNDPIRGYVALWALPQLIEEGQEIQGDLNNLAKTL